MLMLFKGEELGLWLMSFGEAIMAGGAEDVFIDRGEC